MHISISPHRYGTCLTSELLRSTIVCAGEAQAPPSKKGKCSGVSRQADRQTDRQEEQETCMQDATRLVG